MASSLSLRVLVRSCAAVLVAFLFSTGMVSGQCELQRVDVTALQLVAEATQAGQSIAASGDRLVTASHQESPTALGDPEPRSGAVYVHRREGGAWVLEQRIESEDPVQQLFAFEVALDGDTLAVGMPTSCAVDAITSGCGFGRVAVYEFGAAGWQRVAVLGPADPQDGDIFGTSIALQGDRMVVGAAGHDAPGGGSGAVYVFERIGGSWTQVARLLAASEMQTALFGLDVALDGDLIAVTAPAEGLSPPERGALYVFERSGAAWLQRARLELRQWIDGFGVFRSSVAVAGRRIVLGAPRADQVEFFVPGLDEALHNGAAHLVEEVDGAFVHTATLRAGDATTSALFGSSVAAQGERILIGSSGATGVTPLAGAAYLFESTPLGWAQRAKFFAADAVGAGGTAGLGDRLGFAVALDGDLLAFGAPHTPTGPLILTGATYTASATQIPCAGQLLSGAPTLLSMQDGGRQVLHVQAGAQHAGRLHLLLGSGSGTTPGLDLPGNVHVPLVADAYFQFTLGVLGQAPFVAGLGVLDAQGSATAAFDLPAGLLADPVFVGLTLHHAALVFDTTVGGFVAATNAVRLRLVP